MVAPRRAPVSRYGWSPGSVETEGDRQGEDGTATVLRSVPDHPGGPGTTRCYGWFPRLLSDAGLQAMIYQAAGWVITGDAHAARGMGRSSHAA